MEFIVGSIIVFLLYKWISSASKANMERSFRAVDLAEPFFAENGIDSSTAKFNTKHGRPYTLIEDGVSIVGIGNLLTGEPVGFAIEVHPLIGASGVVINNPSGLSSNQMFMASMQSSMPVTSIAKVYNERFPKQ